MPNRGKGGHSHLFLQHRAPGEGHKVLLEGPILKGGGQFPWQIMVVRGRLNVFTGGTYLIPEYRSDIVWTKMRPHIQMSQTESPGASEVPPCPFYTCSRMNIRCCGIWGWTLKSCNSIWHSDSLSKKKKKKNGTTKENRPEGRPCLLRQQRSQGLYLTVVGIVGAAIQEHFQCTAKVDWDLTSSSVSNVSSSLI